MPWYYVAYRGVCWPWHPWEQLRSFSTHPSILYCKYSTEANIVYMHYVIMMDNKCTWTWTSCLLMMVWPKALLFWLLKFDKLMLRYNAGFMAGSTENSVWCEAVDLFSQTSITFFNKHILKQFKQISHLYPYIVYLVRYMQSQLIIQQTLTHMYNPLIWYYIMAAWLSSCKWTLLLEHHNIET